MTAMLVQLQHALLVHLMAQCALGTFCLLGIAGDLIQVLRGGRNADSRSSGPRSELSEAGHDFRQQLTLAFDLGDELTPVDDFLFAVLDGLVEVFLVRSSAWHSSLCGAGQAFIASQLALDRDGKALRLA